MPRDHGVLGVHVADDMPLLPDDHSLVRPYRSLHVALDSDRARRATIPGHSHSGANDRDDRLGRGPCAIASHGALPSCVGETEGI